ncbi:MAG TPA: potassium/proton antiporter [Gemmatimonadaceae bacterium]|nr:potassium/proton antiporter [Gemmatimonadaceae bacterium]
MLPTEPIPTALLLATIGVLMTLSVLFSRASGRIGVPVALLFLFIGMAAGSEGLGGLAFDDYALAFRLGTVALALILFDGGLNTPLSAVMRAIKPAAVLATFGVVGTAGMVAWAATLLGFGWPEALLLGAVVSSTDAAAVFSVLRGSGLSLKRRVSVTLELESGLNDPMAVILTIALTGALLGVGPGLGWSLVGLVATQLTIGLVLGVAIGYAAAGLLARTRLQAGGLYPVLTLAIAFLAFSVPTLMFGSGFLSVYVAAVVIGNAKLPYRGGIVRVHDAIAWFSQIMMFLVLGMLVFPRQLIEVAGAGLALALFLAFVARPLVTLICLAPFRYPMREMVYVGWVGLRGAVPIILATYPILAQAPGAQRIFNVVFFIVVVNALVPGGTVRWVTRWFDLESREPPPPPAVLEINSTQLLRGDLHSFYVDPAVAVAGMPISQVPFPPGSSILLIVRGDDLIAPKGSTILEPGDHVYLFAPPEEEGFLRLMFGRPQSE